MIQFEKLWSNHPRVSGDKTPCKTGDDKAAFDNQCAIRLGVSLELSGIKTASFTGARCWYKDHKPKHILRAEELAKWLVTQKQHFPSVEKFTGEKVKEFYDAIKGRNGLIFFKDYYGQSRTGDHIDLWNGSRLTDWRTWFAFTSFAPGINPFGSNYVEAKEIWFWPVIS